jgi:hypothetical protein
MKHRFRFSNSKEGSRESHLLRLLDHLLIVHITKEMRSIVASVNGSKSRERESGLYHSGVDVDGTTGLQGLDGNVNGPWRESHSRDETEVSCGVDHTANDLPFLWIEGMGRCLFFDHLHGSGLYLFSAERGFKKSSDKG